MRELKPTELEVMKHAFTAIPEQMGAALQRSAYSPNIKERKDESCALFTAEEEMIAQAEHIPVHLGAMPNALKSAVSNCRPRKGDQVILNDPYSGGTHLPDITVIKPVFLRDELLGYVVNRAHHSDIGGETPGSMPGDSKTLEEEGIVITPRLLVEDKSINQEVLDLLRSSRSSRERIGDIKAQLGANEKGAEEFKKTVKRFGLEDYLAFKDQVMKYSEKRTRNIIEGLPETVIDSEDFMEWKREVKLKVQIEIEDNGMNFDFSGTDSQVEGNINAPEPVTYSAVYYVLRCLLPADVPVNNGCYRPLGVKIPEGTILNPEPPAAVSAGNVETSQRVVELILRALFEILPDRVPAEGQGTMNNLIIGSEDFTYYETIGGGAGATSTGKGESGVHVHMTNTKNTPIESIENEYPLRVTAYKLRKGSGGEGKNPGGDGIIREIKLLEDAEVSIQSERRKRQPKGVKGGKDGAAGLNLKIYGDNIEEINSKITLSLREGRSIRIETPGGGGWGKP
ncbi:MAG: hydantoinase B/oxoprolinase family protein [Candidatus Thermoplasmatota archaeon]|nr:hydantoinase B/oxoprolinase family protein [Candidatus Thermoplasmatota archaeon]MBS3789933.1 hydantoinase B/oxoprolinase family protein [Candidatus Thermoplasmatota archaeon]